METLQETYLGNDTYKQITATVNLATLKVFEEANSDEYSELDCILNEDISKVFDMIKNSIISKILNFRDESEKNIRENLELHINEMRMLTNIYELLRKKLFIYGNDNSVIVKIG